MDPKNEITPFGLIIAGFLLIIFLIIPIILITGLWPDKISDDNHSTTYCLNWFHVQLQFAGTDSTKKNAAMPKAIGNDSAKSTGQKIDTNAIKKNSGTTTDKRAVITTKDAKCTIDLNTLLLILVACGGFLGNMVHVASSFISYVGANQFKKSWLLWYFVKPFTAAGLALALYFALRAGFLNSSSGSASINIYGIMIAAILTGLFTDNATLKLKEIFETIFKPKDDRPDKLKP